MRESVEDAVHHALIAVAAAALVALAVALFLLWRRKREATARAAAGGDGEASALPVIPLADVERATDGFHPSRVIGRGRHFTVYAAAPGLAAKRMRPHLAAAGAPRPMSWRERAAVAAGTARGLAHLHAHGVAHGRVSPRNVLVDAAAASHGVLVSDYGLSTFLHDDIGDGAGGAPESDVYMFGAVLLQLLTGRQWDGGRLAQWALPLIRAGATASVLDVERAGEPADKAESRLLARTARVALACVANDGRSRPRMSEVSAILDDVEAAYRRRDGGELEREVDGGEERFSGCLLGPGRSTHRSETILRLPV
uniref:Protein kinase domain-containing protein n=1 Tax=Leersia perrieri TaxID=77586 RepID=A0A0D9X7C5_9ORYZ